MSSKAFHIAYVLQEIRRSLTIGYQPSVHLKSIYAFFADPTKLVALQSGTQVFGPLPGDETNRFRIVFTVINRSMNLILNKFFPIQFTVTLSNKCFVFTEQNDLLSCKNMKYIIA
jgi:hypothetical protein